MAAKNARNVSDKDWEIFWRKVIGEKINALRALHGMSQKQLGDQIGLEQPNISEIERGSRGISLWQFLLLARVFQMKPSKLMLFCEPDSNFDEVVERAKAKKPMNGLSNSTSAISQ